MLDTISVWDEKLAELTKKLLESRAAEASQNPGPSPETINEEDLIRCRLVGGNCKTDFEIIINDKKRGNHDYKKIQR
mgnify:CR=1 FL=1